MKTKPYSRRKRSRTKSVLRPPHLEHKKKRSPPWASILDGLRANRKLINYFRIADNSHTIREFNGKQQPAYIPIVSMSVKAPAASMLYIETSFEAEFVT
jgi:hypothetical protein